MDHDERAERQKTFLARWLKCRHLGPALLEAGILWQHVQSWRRWDHEFRKQYDETREKIQDARLALCAARKVIHLTRREAKGLRVVFR